MANTLRFKRGLASGIPTGVAGEPLFTTDTFDLYIGNGTTNTRFQKYIASGATTQILRGDGSLYTFPLAISSPSNGQVLKYNGTSWVNDSDAGITGSLTTNYLPKATGATTLGNSLVYDNGTGVGIGTASPNEKLVIYDLSSSRPTLLVGQLTTRTLLYSTYNSQDNPSIEINTSTTDGFAGLVLSNSNNTSGNTLGVISFSASSTSGSDKRGAIIVSSLQGSALSNITANLQFYTSNAGVLSVAMRITPLGNLHIGTFSSDSGEKLQVTGTMKVTGASYLATSSGSVGIGTSTPDASFKLTISGNSGANTPGIYFNDEASSPVNYTLYTNGNKNFVLRNQSSAFNIATFTPSGNLGLGVTPSAWSGLAAIQSAYGVLSGNLQSNILLNAYYDVNTYRYVGTGEAARYRQDAGTHAWYNAPSGTAGNAITFTQAMTLTALNNLLVGSTSDSGEKLQVTGTMKVTDTATITTSGGNILNFRRGTDAQITLYQDGTNYGFYNNGRSVSDFVINYTTGAATFSSRINGVVGGTLYNTAGLWLQGSTITDGIAIGGTSGGDKNIDTYGGVLKINATSGNGLSVTGAATFSSSVTAESLRINNNSNLIGNGRKIFGNDDAANYYIGDIGGTGGLTINWYGGIIMRTLDTERMRITSGGDVGIGMTPSYKLDVTGSARISDAIAIGTTPDTNNPFKILKNINSTVGIKFENTNTSSSAFSAVQLGTDVSGGTKFTNLVYSSSGVTASGVYQPDGTSLINNGNGGLNFLGNPIRMYTGGSNGVLRWDLVSDGYISHYSATAPTTSATDGYRQYSADVVAGNAAPHFRTENGAVIKLYQETTAVGNAIFNQGGGNAVLDDSTFAGYTLRQIVKALQNQGILA